MAGSYSGIHGFVNSSDLEAEEHTAQRLVLKLTDSENTREMYPFAFVYWLTYELVGNKLNVTFAVENNDKKVMYFGVGGHPGFAVPLDRISGICDHPSGNHAGRQCGCS